MNPIIRSIAESTVHTMIQNADSITRLKDDKNPAMPSAEQALLISKLNITQHKLLISYAKYFVTITFDRASLTRQLDEVVQATEINKLEDEFLLHGAPKKMMRELFGMNASEYSNRRNSMGQKGDQAGRTPTCNEAIEHKIWQSWQSYCHIDERQRFLQVREETGLKLNIIWNALHSYLKNGRTQK